MTQQTTSTTPLCSMRGYWRKQANHEDTPARIRELGRVSPMGDRMALTTRAAQRVRMALLLVAGQHEAEQHHRISSHKFRGGLPVREGSDGLI